MTQSLPLVSVIVPVYNHDKYVAEALTSILEQSYRFLEIIIIDDGSDDTSSSVIETLITQETSQISDKKIIFIKQMNQGAHAAINRGLALASGEFLTILNSDDYYSPKRIEVIMNQLMQEKAEWAFTGVLGIDQKGKPLPIDHYWQVWYEQNMFYTLTQMSIGFQLLQENTIVSSGNLFFSRNIYEKVGEFKNLKLAHYDYALRALLIAEPIFIQNKLYFYRHRTSTFEHVNHLALNEKNSIYKEYLSQISLFPPENKNAPCHWYWPIAFPKFRDDHQLDKVFLSDLLNNKATGSQIALKNVSPKSNFQTQIAKKITLITHSLCLSGAPKVVLDLALLLKRQKHKINIISLADGPLRKEFEALGISVICVPEKLRYWYHQPKKLKKIQQILKLLCYLFFKTQNIVICNCVVSWSVLFPLVFFSSFRKFYWYIHDSFPPSALVSSHAGLRLLKKIKNKANLKLWFGSDSTRQIWKDSFVGEVKYWSGLPKQQVKPSKKDSIKSILSIGSLSPRKAPHILLDAFVDCVESKRIPEDVTLTIVGFSEAIQDAYLCELLIRRNKLDFKHRIHFVKSLDALDLQPYYERADLYVQSSLVECLPLALLQAMSLGLPIITTNVNGCTEAIQHLQSGYVCSSRSHKALTDAIVEAINHPEKSYNLGLNAQQRFNEMFSLEKTQDEILRELQ